MTVVHLGMVKVPDLARKALTLASILGPVRPLVGPVLVVVELSTRCNFTCLMCPHYSPLLEGSRIPPPAFMDRELVRRVLVSAARMGAKRIRFAGRGEPLLHPGFGEVIRTARSLGLESEVFTNGSVLTVERLEEVVEAGLSVLRLSLVGSSPETSAPLPRAGRRKQRPHAV